MMETTRLILFTEIDGQARSETTIYVEDISEFVQWWISAPPLDMKVEVPGDIENTDIHSKMGKELPGVSTV